MTNQMVVDMTNVPALAVPQLAPCASSARAWRLCAARHSQVEAQATGRPATASGARASRLQSRRFHCVSLPLGIALNYRIFAMVDDGSCVVSGCTGYCYLRLTYR